MPNTIRIAANVTYNPATGEAWVESQGKIRKVAGRSKAATDYIKIRLDGRAQNLHRVIAEAMLGAKRGQVVDHINNNRRDNRLENLRVVSMGVNNQKRLSLKGNLPIGVALAGRNTYFARIGVDGRIIYLGSSNDPAEAHALYMKAKKELHGDLAADYAKHSAH